MGVNAKAARPERPRLSGDDPLPPEDRRAGAETPPLGEAYRTQKPALLRFFRRRAPEQRAEDLVQQTFLRFASLGDEAIASIRNHEAYIRRTADNLLRDEFRTAVRRPSYLHVPAEGACLAAPDQIAALEARDMLNRLEAAMLRLKPKTREIFLAHRIDGCTYAEIAMRTGLSIKGVEKHMSRAIAHLDRVLDTL